MAFYYQLEVWRDRDTDEIIIIYSTTNTKIYMYLAARNFVWMIKVFNDHFFTRAGGALARAARPPNHQSTYWKRISTMNYWAILNKCQLDQLVQFFLPSRTLIRRVNQVDFQNMSLALQRINKP